MSNKQLQSGNIFITSIVATVKHTFKLSIIVCAWSLKFSGMFLSKCGETIEQILIKSHR